MLNITIIRIPILPLGIVNCHIIRGSKGCILVDAGLQGSPAKIGHILNRHGLSYKDIKLIVITHTHVDHAGGAALLRDLSGALIVGHTGDAPYFGREATMTYCPTGWFGCFFSN